MRSIAISDGEMFRENVQRWSENEWPNAAAVAHVTGILAGPDGPNSRGMFCERCGFGLRREFGPYPANESRTSLANDFTDEAHRRDCPHWKPFVEHPRAFARSTPIDPVPPDAPSETPHSCGRCSKRVSALFRCLGIRVCFRCLGEVLQLTGGYRGLKMLMTVESASEKRGRPLREPDMGRCRACRSYARLIPIKSSRYCRPCATTRIQKLLATSS
ncbi:MAG TPA: hypothetical protein VFS34_03355 [Thermoanaerobaculia bacterium]|nr:hypothetical protein [Thermoanaerobaculia bacterium]